MKLVWRKILERSIKYKCYCVPNLNSNLAQTAEFKADGSSNTDSSIKSVMEQRE
jgi:hypothetical protein